MFSYSLDQGKTVSTVNLQQSAYITTIETSPTGNSSVFVVSGVTTEFAGIVFGVDLSTVQTRTCMLYIISLPRYVILTMNEMKVVLQTTRAGHQVMVGIANVGWAKKSLTPDASEMLLVLTTVVS